MNELLEIVFENRGYTKEFIKEINQADYEPLMDIDLMSDELYAIRKSGELITLLPDFDMDGIMSGVVGFAGLAELGFNVSLFIPDPKDGYGIKNKTIERLVSEYPDVKTIITADVGISSISGVKKAKELGIKVLITDHHIEEKGDSVRDIADVIVNPMRYDETYKNPAICGAHVLWQVLDNYTNKYGSKFEVEQIRRLRVFAGIGTVSDMMPVLYENRQIVRDAVDICRLVHADGTHRFIDNLTGSQIYLNSFRGLYESIEVFHASGKVNSPNDIDEGFFGYYLSPMFNAVKRMDVSLEAAFSVFFDSDPIQRASNVYLLNEKRKTMVADYFELMQEEDSKYAPYIYHSEASSGILGLLATKMRKLTVGPVLVLREENGRYTGSGRSPSWYPARRRILDGGFWAAGHDPSFGVGVDSDDELEALFDFLEKDVQEYMDNLTPEDLVDVEYDYNLGLEGTGDVPFDIPLFYSFVSEVNKLKPFGKGFPEPVGKITFEPQEGKWSTMGGLKQHVKVTLHHGFEILCWNQAHLLDELKQMKEVTVIGRLGKSEFRGRDTINFVGDFQVGVEV